MISSKKIKQIMNYDEYLSNIVDILYKDRKSFYEVSDNNICYCMKLLRHLMKDNTHNLKPDLDHYQYPYVSYYKNSLGKITFAITRAGQKVNLDINIDRDNCYYHHNATFTFNSYIAFAKFLINEKKNYLKIVSEILHIRYDNSYSFKDTKSKLEGFSFRIKKDLYNYSYLFRPKKNSKYVVAA